MSDTKFDKVYEAALQAVKNGNGNYEARIDALIKASKVLAREANTLASELENVAGIDSYRVEEAASMLDDVEGALDRAKDNLKRKK
jgi:phage shock protein A